MSSDQKPPNNVAEGGDAAADGALRRLVGRLCLAGLGRSPELDTHLQHINRMARTGLDIAQIQSVLEPLTRAVSALDAPATGSAGREAGREHDDLRDQREQLQREKAEIEQLLRQFDSHLETLTSFFAHQEEQHTSAGTDSERLNTLVLQEMQAITSDMGGDHPLGELRGRIGIRLRAIGSHMSQFRAREQQRRAEQSDHIHALRGRVEELERESRSLRHHLREEQRQAMMDPLTGTPNRAAWNECIAREFSGWQREAGVISLLLWDVDHFKVINDKHGHQAGDEMLRALAQLMAGEMRTTDFFARYGGEEFAMLLAHRSADEALKIANRIRAKVREMTFRVRDTRIAVTVSCGITTFRMGDTPDSAFERADRALYDAKDDGRNRCVVR